METLTSWSDQHLADCKSRRLSPRSLAVYAEIEREFIAFVGSDDPAALSLANGRAWLTAMNERELKRSTVKLRITVLKVWANWLEEQDIVVDSPLRKLKSPKAKKPVIDIFTAEQVADLCLAARLGPEPARDLALLHFAFDTMIRADELRQAKIPPAFSGPTPDLRAGKMKILGKGAKERFIHYEAETAAVVAAYLATRTDDLPWLFLQAQGTPFADFTFLRLIQRLGSRANIRGVRVSPHTLRHTGAVRFLQAHPDNIAQLRARLGHETLDMTLRYATRATEESVLSDTGRSVLTVLGLQPEDEVA